MNTIYEKSSVELNNDTKTQTNGNIISSISSTSETITSTFATSSLNNNGNTTTINGNGTTNGNTADSYVSDLKVISQLKNIEKINEKRRIFLTNTISEYRTDEKIATNTNTSGETNDSNGKPVNNGVVQTINEQTTHLREEYMDSTSDASISSPKYTTPLKSPVSPPPKPPMLSRTRSIGIGDTNGNRASINSLPETPTKTTTATVDNTNNSVVSEQSQTKVTSSSPKSTEAEIVKTTIVTAALVPEVVTVTTMQLKEDTPVLRRVERPASVSPAAPKLISPNHYERLIEELKCPGHGGPMKAPILLCKTGHSVCDQCTRLLVLCPLCKEPFTTMRSHTVEALCSKAHFRCGNASGGCTVRLQIDLLDWHEKQCIYKPMKCFMGRVWGDCKWSGREAHWKDHLVEEHSNKLFKTDSVDLIWNMGVKQKPLTGYYVFDVFGEMFNFYEIYDKERVLYTMTCTSNIKEKKHVYAYEVTIIHEDNEALAITQKFPVHSEYDSDILAEGTCVSIQLSELAKFIDEEKLLHYRVRVLEVKSPRKQKPARNSQTSTVLHPIDFQQTQIEGSNLKNVPSEIIVTRKMDDIPYADNATTPTSTGTAFSSEDELDRIRRRYNRRLEGKPNESDSDSDPEFEAFIAKKWGTPQLHFNRKYLKNPSSDSSSVDDTAVMRFKNGDTLTKMDKKFETADKVSISSTSTSYTKKVTNTLRKSFRSLKAPIIELKPFSKKSPEKNVNKQEKEVPT
ncbi:uncharacterized protein LOC119670768 [Teleopsis dalmanni]|uniref:uncharacterized protein LOC119670768 n=1 Tax=Teleopsis dalmanni TaxID=139649 RepID=UPI0018CF897B|nr:uncharacterized protein LOC119670768 [Teleopsis dalmanni]